ncbi:hypothetical protein D9619_011366 [Psilocybe cf. subviscida]|uniref:Uncharacterized protein n=1 Tax=Psilocybe cf. subviscida TaxID=2480587 RepID=A0A8H5BIV2_9AGAR|nr:hypothetical protein D9619_011366 [Psilocybe cf. subviscida]
MQSLTNPLKYLTGSNSTKKQSPRIQHLDFPSEITNTLEAVDGFPACVLLTDPIFSNTSDNYTVRNVEFVITSHDQGWCNEDNFKGAYEGSWTWFEVAILRPAEEDAVISSKDKANIGSEPCITQTLTKEISDKLRFIIYEKSVDDGKSFVHGQSVGDEISRSPFWHLQRNQRGSDKPHRHTINWNRDRTESISESLGWDFDPQTGEGSGVGFVLSLQKGDRIVVIARAKQSGSANYVSEANIRIYFEVVQPADDTPAAILAQQGSESAASNTQPQLDALRLGTMGMPDGPTLGERPESTSMLESPNARAIQAVITPGLAKPGLISSYPDEGGAARSKTPPEPVPNAPGGKQRSLLDRKSKSTKTANLSTANGPQNAAGGPVGINGPQPSLAFPEQRAHMGPQSSPSAATSRRRSTRFKDWVSRMISGKKAPTNSAVIVEQADE